MSQEKYNTNLAAEFYVLSTLHRLGANATLTLGNKKSVDITVIKGAGKAITIDVKGLAGKTSWPVDNVKAGKSDHYLIFVCYNGKINQPNVSPDVWIIPSLCLASFVYISPNKKRHVVQRSTLRKKAQKYKDAWKQLN